MRLKSFLILSPIATCILILLYNAGNSESSKILKYLPHLMLTVALGISFFYRDKRSYYVWDIFKIWILLASWIILGSLYARFSLGVVENFLSVGLSMLVAPMVAYITAGMGFSWVDSLRKFLLLIYPIAIIIYMYGFLVETQVLHMAIFILLPIPFLLLKRFKITFIK